MSPPARRPRLLGAWVRHGRRSGDLLILDVENVRSGPVVSAGAVIFTGVQDVEAAAERPHDRPGAEPEIRGEVAGVRSGPGATTLDLRLQTGPADMDRWRFTVRHTGLQTHLRPSLARTLRGLVGLYPWPHDLTR